MPVETEKSAIERSREKRGTRMFARRRQVGVRQDDVAKDLGMSGAGFGMKERGINGIDVDEIPVFAQHLNVPILWSFEENSAIQREEVGA